MPIKCKFCSDFAIKRGRQKNGNQRFFCKNCNKSFQEKYKYKAYSIKNLRPLQKLS